MSIEIRGLYAILDWPHRHGLEAEDVAEALIEGGATLLQLRAKQASPSERAGLLDRLAPICARRSVPLFINDDLELALARGGTPGFVGVHLGQSDLGSLDPDNRQRLRDLGLLLGISTHTPAQVEAAITDFQPDYIGFGPVFPTASKEGADPVVGLEQLRSIFHEPGTGRIPVVAIGGIDVARAASVAATGVAAMAAIAALVAPTREDTIEQTRALAQAFVDGTGPAGPT
ncbi:MAG: thiamine phosphate synthase [Myxococcales bacterium]|nr:thiamine phosphate synthase [Myxococcales bacterium]